jgi:hypothetical protein
MMMKSKDCCTRRHAVQSLVGGSLMLPAILSELLACDEPRHNLSDPLVPKLPHFAARAKRMILLFSTGGVAHMETFDYKPELYKADGKMTGVGGGLSRDNKPLLKPAWEFSPGGQCGTKVSDLFPHLRDCVDDICLIRSMKSDDNEHFQATLAIHTGSFSFARPSLGSWVSYGLGSFNQNLPSFIVIAPHLPYAGTQVFSNDFLPAYHQGIRVQPGSEPIPNLARRTATAGVQELELGLAEAFNREHLSRKGNDAELAARIRSFETAYRMQTEAPEAFDLSQESDETLRLYGLERGKNDGFAWQCLVARRLAERGVRFIELIDTGSSNNWDAHSDMAQIVPLAKNIDKPVAGLLRDLKRRGMLDETLVVWTTEFGRTPGIDGAKGRGHHGACFSSWMAGGGARGGIVYGETDEIGATVASDEVHVHDFHATILHMLGLDHTRLTYRHAGRDFRLTDVAGTVVHNIL